MHTFIPPFKSVQTDDAVCGTIISLERGVDKEQIVRQELYKKMDKDDGCETCWDQRGCIKCTFIFYFILC